MLHKLIRRDKSEPQPLGETPSADTTASLNTNTSDLSRAFPRIDPLIDSPIDQSDQLADTATSELGTRLIFSAQAIEKHHSHLNQGISALRGAIAGRLAGESRLAAQGLRLVIGVVWLFVALALMFGSGGSTGSAFTALPAADAAGLARLFLIAAAPACLFAIIAAIYVQQSTGTNRRIRQSAENLGLHIAGVAREFDDKLSKLLVDVNREQDPGTAAESLSLAHITALEAQIFFRRLKFLHAESRSEALDELGRFLKGGSGKAPPLVAVFFIGLMTGILVPMIMGVLGAKPGVGAPAAIIPDIFQYPGFFATLFFGGLLYVIAGLITDMIMPGVGGVRRRAMEDALDSLRSAYTADDAPRFGEVIRRVEESMGAFRSRLDALRATAHRARRDDSSLALQTPQAHRPGSQNAPPQSAQHLASKDGDLAWRHRDTKARFVDPGFQATPKPFSVDRADKPVSSSLRKKS